MDTSDSSQPNPAPPAARRRTRRDPPQLLTHEQQELFLNEIERGLSVSHACRKLDLLPGDVDQTLRKDPGFAGLCAFAQKLLTGDIEMAAYATALKGTAAAQALYLRFHPPSAGENRRHDDHFDEYSDAELIDLMRKQGGSIPPELLNEES